MYKGEWIVFVPSEEAEIFSRKETEKKKSVSHDHVDEDHENHGEKEEKHGKTGQGHEEHGEEPAYVPTVVKILAVNGDEVGVAGLNAGQEYVSKGVYFVKSLLLKSELGEHGH